MTREMTMIAELLKTEEERERRTIEEIEHLNQNGLATFEEMATLFRLRRKAAKRQLTGYA